MLVFLRKMIPRSQCKNYIEKKGANMRTSSHPSTLPNYGIFPTSDLLKTNMLVKKLHNKDRIIKSLGGIYFFETATQY